jgi:predicted component of type VI protein secretion system
MAVVLTVVLYRRQPPTQPLSQRFDARTVTIGRAPGNDWVLPDPDAHLSKRHCVLQHQGDRWLVTDTSTNGVWVNRAPTPLGAGHSAVLKDGDLLMLGDYEVAVGIVAEETIAEPEASAAPAAGEAPPRTKGTPTRAMPPGSLPPPLGAEGDLAAFHAFLAGAGVPATTVAPGAEPEVMRGVGETFRALAGGLRELLAARAAMKSAFRIEQTVIRSGDNNPLKFAMDVDQVVAALIAGLRPGYMAPLDAIEQSFDDLKSHEVAMLAAAEGAVLALLRELAPEAIEAQAESKGSLLEALVPGARKARSWEVYEERYREIVESAMQDVNGIFHRAFARSYEERVKDL